MELNYNSLPADMRDCDTVSTFINAIDACIFTGSPDVRGVVYVHREPGFELSYN